MSDERTPNRPKTDLYEFVPAVGEFDSSGTKKKGMKSIVYWSAIVRGSVPLTRSEVLEPMIITLALKFPESSKV